MVLDVNRIRKCLKGFNFATLFVEELGWDRHSGRLNVQADNQTITLEAIAHKRGMVVYTCQLSAPRLTVDDTIRKIETQVAKSVYEHLIVYTDTKKTEQIWQWAKREQGKPIARRHLHYNVTQSGEPLVQKLLAIVFALEEEEDLTIVEVSGRVRAAFDVEKVTKRFYDRFQKEHLAFLKFIEGIPDEELERWYASVMLNRLMFIYFIQKKGFLDGDINYLANKLAQSRQKAKDRYYKDFLCPLFFEGFAKQQNERDKKLSQLLGNVPYLNGGIFQKHQIEEHHGQTISICDKAFEKMFEFFEAYQWHLDERPLRKDNEINPDVLGYIFEKYINQKQMGAYYTKEDITGYISQNSVIPRIFDMAKEKCKIAFEGEQSVWRLLKDNPDRYIYDAVKKGVTLPLPDNIAVGLDATKSGLLERRKDWNDPASSEYALPTEIWREVVARRKRYEEVRAKLANGEIKSINDLITYNLDIRQFAQDVVENCEGPELLRAIWHSIVGRIPRKSNGKFEAGISILDPACGSGAFLFAALNILEPLYEACLERMQLFVDDLERGSKKHSPEKFSDFKEILAEVDKHPNAKYFIYKSIIVNNLFGVDIMEEAIEICKLRLFLKLVAQVDTVERIEPLPDIDFNIRVGNTLVGYATLDEVKKAIKSKLDFGNALARITEKAEDVNRRFLRFRQQQISLGGKVTSEDKAILGSELKELESELNGFLAGEYGVREGTKGAKEQYANWLRSHKPFHWLVDFYGIIKNGGFDVIIGNPPYVEYSKVKDEYTIKNYKTENCGNLYAFVWERCLNLGNSHGHTGMIVPVSSVCTDGYASLQVLLRKSGSIIVSNFNDRPSRLFEGLEHCRLSIILHQKNGKIGQTFSTAYNKWQSVERCFLFQCLAYIETSDLNQAGAFAKIGTRVEDDIIRRLNSDGLSLGELREPNGQSTIFYTRKISHFVQILDFIPVIKEDNGRERPPSELKTVTLATDKQRDVFLSILNASMFYWLLTVYSDCRNLNNREVERVCFNINRADTAIITHLSKLSRQLMADIRSKSRYSKIKYRNLGTLTIQCIYPKYSKTIIDEIDKVLAKHYGFTDEELDFIINYDIKYRMGQSDLESEE